MEFGMQNMEEKADGVLGSLEAYGIKNSKLNIAS
jgi:hypothetical protein